MDARVVWIRVLSDNPLIAASVPPDAVSAIQIAGVVITRDGQVHAEGDVAFCTLDEIPPIDWREFTVPGDELESAVAHARQNCAQLIAGTIRGIS